MKVLNQGNLRGISRKLLRQIFSQNSTVEMQFQFFNNLADVKPTVDMYLLNNEELNLESTTTFGLINKKLIRIRIKSLELKKRINRYKNLTKCFIQKS